MSLLVLRDLAWLAFLVLAIGLTMLGLAITRTHNQKVGGDR